MAEHRAHYPEVSGSIPDPAPISMIDTPMSCEPLSIWRKVAGFFASGIRVARSSWRGDPVFVPGYTLQYRRAVCNTCPCSSDGRCRVCSCFFRPKTLFTTERCPKGLWT